MLTWPFCRGGAPLQFREVMGHESKCFLDLWNSYMTILSGGIESGFNRAKDHSNNNNNNNNNNNDVPDNNNAAGLVGDQFANDAPPTPQTKEPIEAQPPALQQPTKASGNRPPQDTGKPSLLPEAVSPCRSSSASMQVELAMQTELPSEDEAQLPKPQPTGQGSQHGKAEAQVPPAHMEVEVETQLPEPHHAGQGPQQGKQEAHVPPEPVETKAQTPEPNTLPLGSTSPAATRSAKSMLYCMMASINGYAKDHSNNNNNNNNNNNDVPDNNNAAGLVGDQVENDASPTPQTREPIEEQEEQALPEPVETQAETPEPNTLPLGSPSEGATRRVKFMLYDTMASINPHAKDHSSINDINNKNNNNNNNNKINNNKNNNNNNNNIINNNNNNNNNNSNVPDNNNAAGLVYDQVDNDAPPTPQTKAPIEAQPPALQQPTKASGHMPPQYVGKPSLLLEAGVEVELSSEDEDEDEAQLPELQATGHGSQHGKAEAQVLPTHMEVEVEAQLPEPHHAGQGPQQVKLAKRKVLRVYWNPPCLIL
jgi:hypothetical protein